MWAPAENTLCSMELHAGSHLSASPCGSREALAWLPQEGMQKTGSQGLSPCESHLQSIPTKSSSVVWKPPDQAL